MCLDRRTRRRRIGIVAALLLVAGVARPASSGARVAIVFSDGVDVRSGLGRDLPLEFRAEGFDVHVAGAELDAQTVDEWTESALADGDVAMIHVAPGRSGDALIDVLLVTRWGLVLKDTVRYVPSDTTDIASVRAVEITRAALLEEAPRPPSADRVLDKDERAEIAMPPRVDVFAAFVAPHVALMSVAPLVQLGLGAGVSFRPTPRIAVDVEGALPLARASASAPEGTAYTSMTLLDAGLSYFFAPPRRLLRPFLGVRMGVAWFSIQGAADWVGPQQSHMAFFGAAGAGVSMRVYDFLWLRAAATAGFSLPQLALRVSGRQLDRVGLPIVLFQLGPEVTW